MPWPFPKRQVATAWQPITPPSSTIVLDEERRRYRTDAPYLLPKDDKETGRLNYQHYILRHVLPGNCYAPVHELLSQGANVLDVGCGTGLWGQDIATAYPQTLVTGFDLEPAPRTVFTPSNYRCSVGNLFDGLPFATHQFQYVHQRLLVAGLPLNRWPGVLRELKRVTAPGGWIELIEMGTTFHHAGPAITQLLTWWQVISTTKGIDASRMAHLSTFLEQAGCAPVQSITKVLPVGSWGGRIGHLMALNMLAFWPSIKPLVHTQLGIAPQVFAAVIDQLEPEWNTHRTQYEVYFACGRA